MAAKPTKILELHYTMTQFLIISDIPPFQLGNIRSGGVFGPIEREQKYLIDYNV